MLDGSLKRYTFAWLKKLSRIDLNIKLKYKPMIRFVFTQLVKYILVNFLLPKAFFSQIFASFNED